MRDRVSRREHLRIHIADPAVGIDHPPRPRHLIVFGGLNLSTRSAAVLR